MASAASVNAVNECFSIGSTVLCTTCFNEEVEGEVLAFDHNTKMLILKCRSKTSEDLSDVFVLNLSLCSNVQVVKECNGNVVEDPQKLNLEQVKIRLRQTVQSRQTYLKSKNADVSPEAQELYRVIAKQFGFTEVSWQGLNIQILNEVTITPPYKAENVVSNTNNENLCKYIIKVMEQFSNSRAAQDTPSTSPTVAVTETETTTTTTSTTTSTTIATTTTATSTSTTTSITPSTTITTTTTTSSSNVNNTGNVTVTASATATASTSSASSPTTSSTLSSSNAASASPVPAN